MELTLHSEFPIDLEKEWDELLNESITHVPFLRYQYLIDWWTTRGGGEWPDDSELAIITARQDSRLIGIAPFFISTHEDEKHLLLLGSIEISDYLDVICREEDLTAFIDELMIFLKEKLVGEKGIQQLDMYNICDCSPVISALKSAADAQDFKFESRRLQHTPYISLPGDWERYLEQLDKKQRHEIRRKMRRMSEGDVKVELYITDEAGKLEDDMDDFLDLMAQDSEKAEFLSPLMRQQMKNAMRCAFSKNCLQLSFLLIEGQKAAGYFSFDFLNRIWVYNSGINYMYEAYSPGWVLLGYMLKWANEHGREEFDFMRGNEDYKYKFGAVDRFILRLTVDF
jgi:CelD/BcsL family acetyltransferase involved in cellulose biosynthesis